MGYVPDKLIIHGNVAATVNNIAAHEMLFRFGIAANECEAVPSSNREKRDSPTCVIYFHRE
jgi:hypothetical protein